MLINDGKVHSTTEYSLFRRHPQNRNPDPTNLRKLEASIKFKNLLSFRPILVNEKGEVIDGQHRLQVAQMLNVEIFYIVQKQACVEDIVLLNENQKKWTLADYGNFHHKSGNTNYEKMFQFSSKNKIPLNVAIPLLNIDRNSKSSNAFKDGSWKFPGQEIIAEKERLLGFCQEVVMLIDRKTVGQKKYLASSGFTKAITTFLDSDQVDFDTFMRKIETKPDLFRGCARLMDYISIFKTVYNYRNQNPLV